MKLFNRHLLFLLFFSVYTIAWAQDNTSFEATEIGSTMSELPNKNFKNEAIYLKTSFFGQRYVKNGVEYRLGFYGRKLKKEFESYPAAMAEFKKYQKQLTIGRVVGVTACLAAVASALHYGNRVSKSQNSDIAPTEAESAIYLGGLTAGLAAGTWGTIASNNTLQRAIFLRNQAICEGK